MIPTIDERILNEPNPWKLTIRELRLRCQSTAAAPERETFNGKRLVRRASIHVTRVLLGTPLTPNWITIISVVVFFIGLGFFFVGNFWWDLAGAFTVFFNGVLDACDGEIARFRKTRSVIGGAYAEPVSHDIQYGLMFLPLGFAAFLRTGSVLVLLAAFCASTFKLMTRLLDQRYWHLMRPVALTDTEVKDIRTSYFQKSRGRRFLHWVKRNTFTSSGMVLPLFLVVLLGHIEYYVLFYGVSFTLLWAMVFIKQLRGLGKAELQATQTEPDAAV